MDLFNIFIFILTSLFSSYVIPVSCICSRGEYLTTGDADVCVECNEGTFMTEDKHKQTQCHDCSKIKNHTLEIVIHECNRTHDTRIICVSGYFRTNGACLVCDSCPLRHVTQPCSESNNAVCCSDSSYRVTDGHCLKLCGPGLFFDQNQNSCSPCPDGQYKSKSEHRDPTCDICSVSNPLQNTEIKQGCNKTHDAVVGCRENYFNDTSWVRYICKICKNCSYEPDDQYEIERCKGTRNTICCSSPSMEASQDGSCVFPATTVSTTTEADTTGKPVKCGKNEQLSSRNSSFGKLEMICKPCPAGTYQDKDSHYEETCKICSDFEGKQHPKTCPTPRDGNLSVGEIVGIVFGICAFILLLGLIICVLKKKKQPMQSPVNDPSSKNMLSSRRKTENEDENAV